MSAIFFRHGPAVKKNQLSRQAACRGHTDLLAKYGAYRQLKTVPSTGRPQAGTLRHQRRQQRVSREMSINRLDIGANIKRAPYPANDRRERSNIRKRIVTARLFRCATCLTSTLPIDPPISMVRR